MYEGRKGGKRKGTSQRDHEEESWQGTKLVAQLVNPYAAGG